MLKKQFRIFAIPLFQDNYSYVVQTNTKQPLLLVDPASPDIIIDCLHRYFTGSAVGHVLYTHKHWDHAGGSQYLYKMLGGDVEVVGGIEDADVIKSVTKRVEGDGEFIVGGSRIRVYKVPCHTRGHVVYHILQTENGVDGDIKEKEKMQTSEGKKIRVFVERECAFTGDTLFSGAIGRFFEGTASQMYTNLKKLYSNIDHQCSLYPGHEYTLQSLKWSQRVQPTNIFITSYIKQLQQQNKQNICTLPTTLKKQLQINLFMKAVIQEQNIFGVSGVEYLRMLRDAKNQNSEKVQEFK